MNDLPRLGTKPLDRTAVRELTAAIAEQAAAQLEEQAMDEAPWSDEKYKAVLAAQQKENALLAGILAATMSTADSQMLAAASSVSQNILQEFGHMKLTERQSLFAARLTIICVSVVGVVLARDPNSSVFGIVSFAVGRFRRRIRCGHALCALLEALQLAGRAGRNARRRPDGLCLEVPRQPSGRRVRHL